MKLYITGDTHRRIDLEKLSAEKFSEQKKLTKEDFLLIAGDFGGVWTGDLRDDALLNEYEERSFTTLFIDGNHENHVKLADYPEKEWNGGRVHILRPSVIHLMRGQVYEIGGKKFFTMGGAFSIDKNYREPGLSWWPEELPSEKEYAEARKNLEKHNYRVDYVITHCCAYNMLLKMMYYIPAKLMRDDENIFFNELEEKLKYKHWYFGHYHLDMKVDRKHTVLYQNIQKIKI